MPKHVYDFSSYKEFLGHTLTARGSKLSFSKALGCQSAFISRIMSDHAELSLEQALKACDYFKFNKNERDYFIFLVSEQKGGSEQLKLYYRNKAANLRKEMAKIKNKISADLELNNDDRTTFFTSWEYEAIWLLSTLPGYNTKQTIEKRLNLSPENALRRISFLVRTGILKEENGYLSSGTRRAHLNKGSDLERGIQISWRLKAIESFSKQEKNDVRFSGLYTLAHSDIEKIQKILLDSVMSIEQVTQNTNEQTLHALCIDWFKV
jgi:uncharacterized protein (TIGR02147 family)